MIYRRGKVWWYAFSIKGRLYRGTCKTEVEAQAQEYHDRMRSEAWRGKLLDDSPQRTVAEAIDRYLKDHAKKASIKDDERYAEFWKEKFGKRGVLLLDDITPDDIREIRDAEVGRPGRRGPVKPATVDKHLAFLRSVVRAAANKWSWIKHPPYVELFNEEDARERYLEPHEIQALVEALPAPFDDMALFAVSTGLRQGNVFGLKWSEVNLVTRTIRFPWMVMKNRKAFSIALNETAVAVIRRQIGRGTEYVFCKDDGTAFEWLPSKMWKAALEGAGLTDVRWHDLRHTWASLLRQAGVGLDDLQEMGGWKSAVMVKRYAHINVDHLREHAAVMDGLLARRGTVQNLHSA